MSKESTAGHVCVCGQRIAFPEQHWPHCRMNPNNLAPAVKKDLPFTKAELATIARHGPQADQHIGKRRPNRSNTAADKRPQRGNSKKKGG